MKGPRVVFDLETGGLIAGEHPVIQFAGVAMYDDRKVESLEVKIQFDEASATPQALKINSYNPVTWARKAIPAADAVTKIADFFDRNKSLPLRTKFGRTRHVAKVVGHNVKFDIDHLLAFAKANGGVFIPISWRGLCTMNLSMWAHELFGIGPGEHSLESLCRYYGIPHDAHDAMGDVLATVELEKRLTADMLEAMEHEAISP